jgi:hypothetical protein
MKINKKQIFRNKDEIFTIRTLDTCEEMLANPQALNALNRLMFECEQDSNKRFHLKNLHTKEELGNVINFNEDWAKKTFDGKQIVFLVESEGNLACTILLRINDEAKRNALKVPESVGTFVYVSDVITEENYKGKGVFSCTFDKIITSIANQKRAFVEPIVYSISMTAAEVLKDNKTLTYPMNLEIYSKIWEKRFFDNKIQVRLQSNDGVQEGAERFKTTDLKKVSEILDSYKEKALSQEKFVRGVYLEGQAPSYEICKQLKNDFMNQRPNYSFAAKNSTKLKESFLTKK